MRTTTESITFRHCFLLKGLDKTQLPGTYEVEIEEERIEGLSFLAYRRVATFIRLPRAGRGANSSETSSTAGGWFSAYRLDTPWSRMAAPRISVIGGSFASGSREAG